MLNVPNDRDYYRRRERECREKAQQAFDPHIRELHLEFAERYAREVRDAPIIGSRPRDYGIEPPLARA
ncbi:MAG: hypothetical protein H7X93_07695 [Sphingomonadaceae bacterium]|nr:hypothetical protein [Sphingomonadaceae bacterium]